MTVIQLNFFNVQAQYQPKKTESIKTFQRNKYRKTFSNAGV